MTSAANPSSDEPPRVTQSVSVVLRRQVPPRAEAPRSWLGGLPMMPAHVAWPRSISAEYPERGERPLHFVAQVACADLPPQLWGGLGPRHGWLLLFIDPNQYQPDGPDALRVMHIETLGAERAAPVDLGPVDDGQHRGSDGYQYCRSPADIPSTWRRWPVDLIAVADEALEEEDDPARDTPSELEMLLHEGLLVSVAAPRDPEPFTWRGALYVLNVIERPLAAPLSSLKLDNGFVTQLRKPGYVKAILAGFDEQHAKVAARPNIIAERAALAAFLERHPTPDAIIEHLHEADQRYRAWRVSACERLARERAAVSTHDLDTPMPDAAWQAIKERLKRDTFRSFTTKRNWSADEPHDVLVEEHVGVYSEWYVANFELVADYYVDARLRELIPPSVLSKFEPYWRCLIDNVPHRMGGYHDINVQWGIPKGPTQDLRLFQIGSDGAMNWLWADVGAYYVVIDMKSLQKGDFSKARLYLDSH
ncbi:MAG: DUF1963 domain-containing protein [Reyranellaceae bacterium]